MTAVRLQPSLKTLNTLERRIIAAEDTATDSLLWEQAREVVRLLDEERLSTRDVAEGWINPRTEKPYSHQHVACAARVYRVKHALQPRPKFRTAYMQEAHGPAQSHNAGDNEWYSPREYTEAARAVLGGIDLDPASTAEANEVVGAKLIYTADQDGLSRPWRGRVWLNPPYADNLVGKFMAKLAAAYASSDVTAAITLTNNATETDWFVGAAKEAGALFLPDGRVKFWHPRKESSPLQGQALLYFGKEPDRFIAQFKQFGGSEWRRA